MSGDTLVIKIVDYGATTTEEISPIGVKCCVYVFYDYKTELFGLRCGYHNRHGYTRTFSYYVDNKEMLIEFLLEYFHDPKETDVALINFPEFPENFHDITYEYLRENDDDKNEISGYTHLKDNEEDNEEDDDIDEGSYPVKGLYRFAGIIESVYNEY